MTAYTVFLLALAVLAPLPWIALYRLDRAGRAKEVRAVANPWGKRRRPVPPLDRRPSMSAEQRMPSGQPGGLRSHVEAPVAAARPMRRAK